VPLPAERFSNQRAAITAEADLATGVLLVELADQLGDRRHDRPRRRRAPG